MIRIDRKAERKRIKEIQNKAPAIFQWIWKTPTMKLVDVCREFVKEEQDKLDDI